MEFKVNDDYLDEILAKVEGVRNWSPRVISKLENFVRTAGDEALFRVSPLQWAADKHVDEHEAIDLFLHSSKAGLFYMEWNVICSCCAKITQNLRDLHSVQSLSTCNFCFRKGQPNLDDSVQISFTLSPSVRPLRFHHPETLSLEDYCFKYLFEPSTVINGMLPLMGAFEYIQKHLSTFSPGERITVETEVKAGILACVDVLGQQSFGLMANGEPTTEAQTIAVKLTDRGFEVPLPEMKPGEFSFGPFAYAGTFYPIRPGRVILEFEQSTTAKAALLVAYYPITVEGVGTIETSPELSTGTASYLEKVKDSTYDLMLRPHEYTSPRLTAKRLFACQTFHDLFRAEVFQDSQGFGVKDVTFLFTDLKGSTQLYQQIGDLNAYALVREHYGILSQAVVNHHGAVVKTIGDAIMASFVRPLDAVGAALEMLRELRRMNRDSHHGALILKIGIHRGAAISVTLNERIDYFGQTVNIASRVQNSAGGDEIYLTEDIYGAEGVLELLGENGCHIEPVFTQLRDVEEQLKIYKVVKPDSSAI